MDEVWTEYPCPFCDGAAFGGDPRSGVRFRGSGRCLDCGKTFSLVGHKLEYGLKPRGQRIFPKVQPSWDKEPAILDGAIFSRKISREDWKPHAIAHGPRKGQQVWKHQRTGALRDEMPVDEDDVVDAVPDAPTVPAPFASTIASTIASAGTNDGH